MDLCFTVHKLVNFASNPGKLHFEGLVHLLIFVLDYKNLGLRYYAKREDAPLSDLLIQASIKIDKKLMVLFDFIWKDCLDTGRSTGEYILFYHGVPIDHCTHIPGSVSQSSAKSEHSASYTAWMALSHFRMIIIEAMNKYLGLVPEHAPLIILDSKSSVCMENNGKDAKQTRHIFRRIHFLINGEEWNFHKTVWCEGIMPLEEVGTKNVRDDKLNPILWYSMTGFENWQNTCTRGVIG